MNKLLLVLCVACGGKSPPPAPVENTAPGAPVERPTDGAGGAKYLVRNASGGVIELAGDRPTAMEAANREMAAHCGLGSYTITQEGEEAVGGEGSGFATAWRVHYQCVK